MASRGAGTTASAAPSRSRSGRGGAGLEWARAGTRRQVGEGSVREDLPDDRQIVERGGQAQPAPTMGTGKDVTMEKSQRQTNSVGPPPAAFASVTPRARAKRRTPEGAARRG